MHKLSIVLLITIAAIVTGASNCNTGATTTPSGGGDSAATVNGKAIKNEQIEKLIKQQFQGQEAKLSPLELAQARLQALNAMIEQEVMLQKAEKEKIQVSDEDVTQAYNQFRQGSGVSLDEFNKKMQEAGETEQSIRERIKKELIIKKLGDKIAGSVQPPSDTEIEAFFKGNPELFINKRGASFAAIVIDPNGNGQTTKSPQEAQLKIKEVGQKLSTPGIDFADLVRQYSEDPESAVRGGDFQAFSEDQMKQFMTPELTDFVMNKMTVGQIVPRIVPFQGKILFLKLTSKQEKDENLTLESPNVKQRVIELLTNAKKQLLSSAYQARAMDEARIENYLAKRVVDNPNELSGARPADPNAGASPAASPNPPITYPSASPAASASPATSGSPAKTANK